jgi:chorismate synthase
MTLDGIPAGLPVDLDLLQDFLNRRAPGQNNWSTPRKEADRPEFLSGLLDGYTCGAPIAAIIHNHNMRSGDYANLKVCPRPGHADLTAQIKYGGYQDSAGGGHFSGRLTAPLCIAGGLCKQWLERYGIHIGAHLASVAGITDISFDPLNPEIKKVCTDFPVLDSVAGEKMRNTIADAHKDGDSVGGVIECAITGLPAGLGEPMFGGMESRIAQIVFGIPAVKGVEFGDGFAVAQMRGSTNNDGYRMDGDQPVAVSNHCGGILGGLTNGHPLIFRAAIKPTPCISLAQNTVNINHLGNETLNIKGRHDPCIAPRAVPVLEAAAAIAIFDAILSQDTSYRRVL